MAPSLVILNGQEGHFYCLKPF